MPNVHVSLAHRSYDIAIGHGLLAETSARCLEWCGLDAPGSALVVTDAHLADSHAATVAAGFEADGWLMNRHVLEPGEPSKSLAAAESMFDSLVALPADRGTLVVAVGGGVVGDAAGFVAATYARGIRFVQVPTTLLAQVDSSVGGKVAVNHPRAKNLIGAFHQPAGVLIDTATLETLPERDYRSGLAEVIKYGVILDAEFFDYLEQHVEGLDGRDREVLAHVIARSCELKAEVVEQDERETTGVRAVLNYGHTFAHAYEALAGYGELLHGEAVSIGMIQDPSDLCRLSCSPPASSIVNRSISISPGVIRSVCGGGTDLQSFWSAHPEGGAVTSLTISNSVSYTHLTLPTILLV